MRIALTHNLQLSDREDEAEFDRPETIAALRAALESLGFEVEPVEVSGPASRTVARLEAHPPDLVFNTAEGRRGKFREAFYPALFEELGLPFTGADAYACTLTLDKQLTKRVVAALGVPTPRWVYAEPGLAYDASALRFPVIVKPNFEGSSKGITEDAIVESPDALAARVAAALSKYPSGVLIEEFIVGRDITVPWLERGPTPGGVLSPAEYEFDERIIGKRKYTFYDYHLKQVAYDAVTVKVPASLEPAITAEAQALTRTCVKHLGLRDLGRVDFRLSDDGKLYFLEVNALPSLEPGAAIYEAAKLAGLGTVEKVLDTVVKSAAARYGIDVAAKRKKKREVLRIGFTYNLKRSSTAVDDREAEYDSPNTIRAIREAIESYGHEVVELEATAELPVLLIGAQVDVVFNMAEGIHGRNRESQIPALLELLDIPYSGSDAAALGLALDKGLAKRLVRQAGIRTPNFFAMMTGRERVPRDFRFPAIVKPLTEGSSKGVKGTSVVSSEDELRRVAREMIDRYRQPALCEEYVGGREFTLGLLGERKPRMLPPLEIVFTEHAPTNPVYSYEHKQDWNEQVRWDVPAKVDDALLRELERVAKGVFAVLGCRDVARVDVRLDAEGHVNFLECNPLPGLTPKWSDLCLISDAAGLEYRSLIGEILAPAIRRHRHKQRKSDAPRPEPARSDPSRDGRGVATPNGRGEPT